MKTLPFSWVRISLSLICLTVLAITARATTLTVKSTADSGGTCPGADCTLRQAIATANAADTINFSLPANSTITLTSTELLISRNLTIVGPGATLLTVQRSTANGTPAFRIFDIAGANVNVTISGLTVTNGNDSSHNGGGGIFNSATLTLTGVIIANNSASGNLNMPNSTTPGGGIYSSGTLTITNCTISGNRVNGGNGGGFQIAEGGGIFNVGTLTLTNSTISGNSAQASGAGLGGGISSNSAGAFTLTNSTISGNSAGGGGGIYTSAVTVTNSTISGNSANIGGGFDIFNNVGTVKLRNTIIAKNTAPNGPDIDGPATSQGFNFVGTNSGATITATAGDQIGTGSPGIDPMLGPLQDNGGPTKTQALLPGSTAIDAGNSSGSITDQRGFARPVDGPFLTNASDGSDIGAYEVQADQLPGCNNVNTVVNNNNDSGTGSLRSVIANVCAGSTITFASNVTGAIDLTSGELLINKSLTINGPGANVLSIQRSAANGTSSFRIFDVSSSANNFDVSISGLTIANGNLLSDAGAGVASSDGTLTLTNVVISGNSAFAGGGGVVNASGTLFVINSTISGNSSTGNSGGGVLNTGKLTVTNSTISGNTVSGAGNDGGGIAGGTMVITNSTIAGNSAGPGNGGGIALDGGSLNCRNTIIALNSAPAGPDVNGTLTSQGFNFIGNSSGATITSQSTDQIGGGDPLLGPLQDNGGPTLTRALLTGSKAIDKGDSVGATTDQRGFTRPVDFSGIANAGDGADIGAFEVQLPTPSPTPTATPTATPPVTAQALNISTRMQVQGGNNVLIAGFIVTGGDQKTVAILGIGPSLSQFFSGTLADPTLELHTGNTTLATNDNWQDDPAQAAQLSNAGLAPSDPKESGIVATLPANASYTAILAGKNGGTGIGNVQIYDISQAASSQLANISSRGFVQAGNNVMIGGFILGGNGTATRVAVRGIGPSLAQFGLSPLLADPTLELHDGNGVLFASDDDWQDDPSQAAQLSANGLALSDPKEAAIFISLPPGQFTAILAGKNGGTGIGVVEVFNLH